MVVTAATKLSKTANSISNTATSASALTQRTWATPLAERPITRETVFVMTTTTMKSASTMVVTAATKLSKTANSISSTAKSASALTQRTWANPLAERPNTRETVFVMTTTTMKTASTMAVTAATKL